MNPLLRSWWWSSESQQGFVGSRIWDVGLFLSDWGWNTTFFTGTGELLSLGETWTSHGSIFFPFQLMFYVVPGVNRCPDDFEIPACESCKDWEIHTTVELSPAGSCGLCIVSAAWGCPQDTLPASLGAAFLFFSAWVLQ